MLSNEIRLIPNKLILSLLKYITQTLLRFYFIDLYTTSLHVQSFFLSFCIMPLLWEIYSSTFYLQHFSVISVIINLFVYEYLMLHLWCINFFFCLYSIFWCWSCTSHSWNPYILFVSFLKCPSVAFIFTIAYADSLKNVIAITFLTLFSTVLQLDHLIESG